jgi:GNAT superfamily N-acetyltransferase
MKAKRAPNHAERRVRSLTFDDAPTLGLLLRAALADAPSAPVEADELGDDLEQVGRDFISAMAFGDESLLLGEIGRHAAGIARIIPREFIRGRHIGTLQILVAPQHRGRGVGTMLREAALEQGFGARRFERLEMNIASHDLALERLIGNDGRRWNLERAERRAMRVDGRWRDVGVWVVDRPERR